MVRPPNGIPPERKKWTFTTDAGSGAQQSTQRFDDIEGAAGAAGEWLTVCAYNGIFPSVALGSVRGDG